MRELILSCYDLNLKIICNEKIIDKIKILMSGYCDFKQYSNNITYTLIIENPIVTKCNQVFEVTDKWFNATGKVSFDNTNNIAYLTDISSNSEKNRYQFIQYFTCNVLNRLLEERGFYGFHSSAISLNNIGIAFIGKRGCGKTNSLLNMMHHGYDFLTNDKLALQYDGNTINGYGVAQDISIRMDLSFRDVAQNDKYVSFALEKDLYFDDEFCLEGNKINLYPNELIKMNNVNQVYSSQIKAIIFPSYNPNITNLIIRELSKDEIIKRLNENQLTLVHETKSFLKSISTSNNSIYSFEETCEQISNLDCFSITQNQNTIKEYAKTINKLYLKY